MTFTLSLLFDEDTEQKLAHLCEKDGHDVERVVTVPELGAGTKDSEVRGYAKREDRIIIAHDDDHVGVDTSDHAGVFYAPNQRLSSFELYRIISVVCETYDSSGDLPEIVYLTEDWL